MRRMISLPGADRNPNVNVNARRRPLWISNIGLSSHNEVGVREAVVAAAEERVGASIVAVAVGKEGEATEAAAGAVVTL